MKKKKIPRNTALELAKKYKINLDKIPLKEWTYGLNVELEHSNITKGDINLTAKIAIAHLMEYPDYYKRLKKMEKRAELYWKNKDKDIFC